MKTLTTRRLLLREATIEDASFLVRLMNESAYLRLIGDRGVRTVRDACDYLAIAPIYRYGSERLGFNIVEVADGAVPVGICGLVRRDPQGDVELGYAISHIYAGKGYATEAAAATQEHAHGELGFARLSAITLMENAASRRVLKKIGMTLQEVSNPDESGPVTCRYVSFKGGKNHVASA
jgi:RimJ/RimL family protein N-acetyltransferase